MLVNYIAFLAPADLGGPGKRAVKRLLCGLQNKCMFYGQEMIKMVLTVHCKNKPFARNVG